MAIALEPTDDPVPPSVAVVRALADAEGVPPEALSITLWDHVDPEALDAVASADGCTVQFPVATYDVTVESDGDRVSVTVD